MDIPNIASGELLLNPQTTQIQLLAETIFPHGYGKRLKYITLVPLDRKIISIDLSPQTITQEVREKLKGTYNNLFKNFNNYQFTLTEARLVLNRRNNLVYTETAPLRECTIFQPETRTEFENRRKNNQKLIFFQAALEKARNLPIYSRKRRMLISMYYVLYIPFIKWLCILDI